MNLVSAYNVLVEFRRIAEHFGLFNSSEIRGIDIALDFLKNMIDEELDEMAEDYYKGD